MISCLPKQGVRNALDNSTDNSSSTETTEESTVSTEIKWLNSGIFDTSVTINVDNQKSIYIAGEQVHKFLSDASSFSSTYCMEIQFPQSGVISPKRLRVKLTPQFSNNLGLGSFTRYFMANTASIYGNDICYNPNETLANNKNSIQVVQGQEIELNARQIIQVVNGVEQVIDTGSLPELSVATVCPTCQNILTSEKVLFFKLENNKLNYIKENLLSQNKLTFRVDMNSNSSSGQNACTDSECIGLGFNCCINGQCVKEKQIKISGVNLDPTGFSIAESYKTTNENWYRSYPQFYFSCLETPPITEPSTTPDPVDPVGDSAARLQTQIADYECLVELDANTDAEPFHRNPINSSKTYTKCNITDSSNTLYYQNVLKRLYTGCGCVEKNDLQTMTNTCPAYTYLPIYKSGSTTDIQEIICVTPETNQTPLPFQDLEVALNARAIPHRFFDSTGIEIDMNKTLPSGITGNQEGDAFQYLDNFYIFPKNGSFNMNSILGQLTTTLGQAYPARVIDLEFDKQYIIFARSGQYDPCPTCGKDSWFNNFTAFPYSNNGVGARSIGYTTRRDTYGSNTTFGNYEDTIFNRACFIPPTMLPYSHTEDSDTQTQRLTRLKTQAALFINGYQRDWYGFNKGALIGSFDGVTWFAIGSGRIVRSTTNKLFLAINGAFGDLATPSSFTVAVQEYDYTSIAAQFDYDPSKEINDPTQNQAASCQENHKCEVDSDCITTLGWEYVCADVGFQRTKWPSFEATGAKEVANQNKTGSIIDFLQQATLPPGSGSKRCVYRGAGSPCRVDYQNITDEGLRKSLACAPNFYCARLTTSAGFNSEVARYGRPLDELVESKNHLYGQDANILGRPKHYVNTGLLGGLPTDVQSTLENNLLNMDPTGTGQFGLCRPGKKLPEFDSLITAKDTDPADQHSGADYLARTDYISQVGSCNSTLYHPQRYSSCPILDEDGNYVHTTDAFINDSYPIEGLLTLQNKSYVTEQFGLAQNSCGLESLRSDAIITVSTSADELRNYSAFRTIEGRSLSSSDVIVDQTLTRDACLRKAGAVCHTDLDCSPNRLHANAVDLVSASFFGNLAEKSYYSESLVCGQARPEPATGTEEYFNYNPHNNRCCRPVGQDLTMFTEDSPRATESTGINSSVFGALTPTSTERYSRYSVVEASINSVTMKSNLIRPTAYATDSDGNKSLDRTVNITNANQWKTIHKAAAKTCCGGNWVRKFEDGSNNWTINRFNIDISNFKCINYKSALLLTEDGADYGLNQFNLESERINYCFDARTEASNDRIGGCIQNTEIGQINDLQVVIKPYFNDTTGLMRLSSNLSTMINNSTFVWNKNMFSYHTFIPFNGSPLDPDRGYVLKWSDAPDDSNVDAESEEARYLQDKFLVTKIPNFVTFDDVSEIKLSLTDPQTGDPQQCVRVYANPPSPITGMANVDPNYTMPLTCSSVDGNGGLCDVVSDLWFTEAGQAALPSLSKEIVTGYPQTNVDSNNGQDFSFCENLNATDVDSNGNTVPSSGNNCCYIYDENTRVVRAAFANTDIINPSNYGKQDVEIHVQFSAVGTRNWEEKQIANQGGISVADPAGFAHRRSSKPGNAMYYLKKLAKLEYIGIPQMTYEPIYCNDNYQKVVPGIFKPEIETVMDFINHAKTFIDSGVDTPWNSDTAPASINANGLNQNLSTTQELLTISPIFSDNQFKCCLELGTSIGSTEDAGQCCSGHAVVDPSNETQKICKLPMGTDLNVYFNKFVSSEGVKPGDIANLNEDDFNTRTGEPNSTSEVLAKLREIGEVHCEFGKVRTGGAFGNFRSTPIGSLTIGNQTGTQEANIFSLIDEQSDDNPDDDQVSTGNSSFSIGFRWNHHVYCDQDV